MKFSPNGRKDGEYAQKKEGTSYKDIQEDDQSSHASYTTQSNQNEERTISSESIQEEEIEEEIEDDN